MSHLLGKLCRRRYGMSWQMNLVSSPYNPILSKPTRVLSERH